MTREESYNVFVDWLAQAREILLRYKRYDKVNYEEYLKLKEKGIEAMFSYVASATSTDQKYFFIENIIAECDTVIDIWTPEFMSKLPQGEMILSQEGRYFLTLVEMVKERKDYWSKGWYENERRRRQTAQRRDELNIWAINVGGVGALIAGLYYLGLMIYKLVCLYYGY